MQRYFFHLRDGEDFTPDEEGMDLPDLTEAHLEAVRGARDILADQLRAGRELDGQRIEITSASGQILETVTFKEALRLDATIH